MCIPLVKVRHFPGIALLVFCKYLCVIETLLPSFTESTLNRVIILFWVVSGYCHLHSLATLLLLSVNLVVEILPIDGPSCQSLHSC